MYAEAKGDLLKRVSLLSACLAPIVKYVPAKVEVTQVRFCGAQGSPLIVRSLKKTKTEKKVRASLEHTFVGEAGKEGGQSKWGARGVAEGGAAECVHSMGMF